MAPYNAPPPSKENQPKGFTGRTVNYLARQFDWHYVKPPYFESNLASAFLIFSLLSYVSSIFLGPEICPNSIPLSILATGILTAYRHKKRFKWHEKIRHYDFKEDSKSSGYNPDPDIIEEAKTGIEEDRESLRKLKSRVRQRITKDEENVIKDMKNLSEVPTFLESLT